MANNNDDKVLNVPNLRFKGGNGVVYRSPIFNNALMILITGEKYYTQEATSHYPGKRAIVH